MAPTLPYNAYPYAPSLSYGAYGLHGDPDLTASWNQAAQANVFNTMLLQ